MPDHDDADEVDAKVVDSSAETLPPFASASAPVVSAAQKLAARVIVAQWGVGRVKIDAGRSRRWRRKAGDSVILKQRLSILAALDVRTRATRASNMGGGAGPSHYTDERADD